MNHQNYPSIIGLFVVREQSTIFLKLTLNVFFLFQLQMRQAQISTKNFNSLYNNTSPENGSKRGEGQERTTTFGRNKGKHNNWIFNTFLGGQPKWLMRKIE